MDLIALPQQIRDTPGSLREWGPKAILVAIVFQVAITIVQMIAGLGRLVAARFRSVEDKENPHKRASTTKVQFNPDEAPKKLSPLINTILTSEVERPTLRSPLNNDDRHRFCVRRPSMSSPFTGSAESTSSIEVSKR